MSASRAARRRLSRSGISRCLQLEALEDRKLLALAVAETLLVDLDARDPSAATGVWSNAGALSDFTSVGNPLLVTRGPNANPAVSFNEQGNNTDAYNGPLAPNGIASTGATRSIEVWAFNPTISPEETLVSIARRGGPDGTNMSFNYGSDGTFGAAGQWGGGPDMGWGNNGASTPVAGEWHHLVITYDGNATSVYSDGVLTNREIHGALPTASGFPIRIAAQTQASGVIELGAGLVGRLSLANIRIHDGVLSSSQVINNFNEDAARFGKTPVSDVQVATAPVHRYSFNDAQNPGLDSIGGATATLVNGATVAGGVLNLANSGTLASSDPSGQYANLPIGGTIAGLTNSTFETWTQFRGGNNWQRAFDIGDNTNEYIFLSPRSGNGTARFEVKDNASNTRITESFLASTNSEHHFVGVINASAGQMEFYIDGALVATNSLNGFTPQAIGATINNWLGRSQFGGDAYYNGTINEFRVYNTALTAAQVRANTLLGPNSVPGVNDAPVAVSDGVPNAPVAVPLQNATAIRSQPGFVVSSAIDANPTGTGWANNALDGNVAVFETVTNLNPRGEQMVLTFNLDSSFGGSHQLGKFRLSYTTDSRTQFADGLQDNGDVTANWVIINPDSVGSNSSGVPVINADGSILLTGPNPATENYTVRFQTSAANITGFRLEVLEDPSLPASGPGRAGNGNYVLQDFRVSAQVGGVILQNATAQFTQAGFSIASAIDGVANPTGNSTKAWANAVGSDPLSPVANVAVFESKTNINPLGEQTLLTFNITSGDFSTHLLGKLRLSVTSDDRATFADGLQTGGDVFASWQPLTPLSVTTSGTSTFTILPDNSILAGGTPQERETYTIRALTNLQNITGFRLEALEDPSLPPQPTAGAGGGPGRGPTNGNFVMQEFSVAAQQAFVVTNEDAVGVMLDVLANDFDPDLTDTFTIQSTSGGQGVVVNNGTHLTYTPGAAFQSLRPGQSAVDSFTYTIRDAGGLTASATAAVVITGVNDAPIAVDDVVALGPFSPVPLQAATAERSQGGFPVSNILDGNAGTGWANDTAPAPNTTPPNTAVVETVSNVNPNGLITELRFVIDSGGFSTHEIGKFRLSYTTDDRSQFADGLATGGDVTANWVVLQPLSITTTGTSTFTINPDGSILAGGTPQERETYTIRAQTSAANITGFRLEAIEDPSLPGSQGPGRGPSNGNYVIYSLDVTAASAVPQSEDAVFNGSGLLANDFDVDNTPAQLSVSPTGPRLSALGATVTVNANGTFTYDPTNAPGVQALNEGQIAVDTFTYTITDGLAISNMATASITLVGANDAPTADANGPYTIAEGQSLQLDAIVADPDAGATLTIAWDLDGDGQFDDAVGASPLVPWTTLTSMTNPIRDQAVNLPISVRVSDGIASPVISNTTLTVTNAPPTVSFVNPPAQALIGQTVEFDLAALDLAPDDQAGNFTYVINWGDGSSPETFLNQPSSTTVSHTYNSLSPDGGYTLTVTATEKDGGTSQPATHVIDIVQMFEEDGVLYYAGTNGSERIILQAGNGLQIRVNGKIVGNFGNISEAVILGNGGNDTITVAGKLPINFTISGGAGNDYIAGGVLSDILSGDAGNDRVMGGNGDDILDGGDGRDRLQGGNGNDMLYGGVGNDSLYGDGGDDQLFGEDGNDRLYGGHGSDMARGGADNDFVDGGSGDDVLDGGEGGDRLYGRNGSDVLIGGLGVDFLYGGSGQDLMIGGIVLDDSDDGLLFLLWDWIGASFEENVFDNPDLFTSNVDEDNAGDSLLGERDADWFLLFANDIVRNASGQDVRTDMLEGF